MKNTLTVGRLRSLLSYDPRTGEFRWKFSHGSAARGKIAGGVIGNGYIVIPVDGKQYPAHRLAFLYCTGEMPEEIDHANGCRSDNRFANLRSCTRSQNNANRRSSGRNTSGYKGVTFSKANKAWIAAITVAGKHYYLGSFPDKTEAAKAYDKAAIEYFGEFATPNFAA